MANPQTENGYIRLCNDIASAMAMTEFSTRETKILFALLRKTYGWNRKSAEVTLAEWSRLTGLLPRHCSSTLKRLEGRKIAHRNEDGSWSLQKDFTLWLPKPGTTKKSSSRNREPQNRTVPETGNNIGKLPEPGTEQACIPETGNGIPEPGTKTSRNRECILIKDNLKTTVREGILPNTIPDGTSEALVGEKPPPTIPQDFPEEKEEKKQGDPSEKAREAFLKAWQETYCAAWEPDGPYDPSSFEKGEVIKRINFVNAQRFIAYAWFYNQKDEKVGVEKGKQAPTLDNFFRAASIYQSRLRNGNVLWQRAKTFSREFLTENCPKLIRQ